MIKFRQFYFKLKEHLRLLSHHRRLAASVGCVDAGYRAYLELQLNRTLSKRRNVIPERCLELMAQVKSHISIRGRDVLCVGCRDSFEIEFFRSEKAGSIAGIDLYSESSHITIMDMHDMNFCDDSFDLVYSSHSLEHALDVNKVIGEFIRVVRNGGIIVIEVPANYETRGADLIDFSTLENLHKHFSHYLYKVVWSETVTNHSGDTTALRTIIKISKPEAKSCGGAQCHC